MAGLMFGIHKIAIVGFARFKDYEDPNAVIPTVAIIVLSMTAAIGLSWGGIEEMIPKPPKPQVVYNTDTEMSAYVDFLEKELKYEHEQKVSDSN